MRLFLNMKNFRLLFVAALVMVMAVSASAQSKVATVNMKKLFDGYYKTKMAKSALEKKNIDLRKEIKDMADGLDKARSAYKDLLDQANDQAISSDERDRRQQAAQEKAKEVTDSQTAIEQFQRQAQAQVSEQEQRMTQNLVADIQAAVSAKAKADGFTMVLNSGNPDAVVYAGTDNDITDAVLTQLNAGAPIDVAQPAPALAIPGTGTNSP
jgi:outer membrane protein